MSRKIERLINLTIALLATKRYLTKTEIFRSVEGYEGSAETKERMFERDKDDLRSLGIDIEVGSFDPLFHDEAGYRIKQEKYQLDLGEITPIEISLLSLAAEAWQGASLDEAAQRALVKLKSMGIPVDDLILPGAVHKLSDSGEDLALLTKAIAEHQRLSFTYVDAALKKQVRSIVPIGLSTRSGLWYITGVDQKIEEIRTFRIDRIDGEITTSKGPKDFETPAGFDPKRVFDSQGTNTFALVDVRKGKASALRALASTEHSLGEWDQLRIPILNVNSLASLVLWHGEDAFVQEPQDLRDLVIQHLEALVSNHG
ncbi:MAG: WYL domain-containing protein [Candidatus Planktophila sp.]|nr:WYL domain-containing protein [Candidatus Planktophila sp.]